MMAFFFSLCDCGLEEQLQENTTVQQAPGPCHVHSIRGSWGTMSDANMTSCVGGRRGFNKGLARLTFFLAASFLFYVFYVAVKDIFLHFVCTFEMYVACGK